MRFDWLCFSLIVLLLGEVRTVFAAQGEPISVQWFEPKVQITDVPGLTYVNLVGLTEPNVSVQVNPESIIVIQPADGSAKVLPRVGETLVQSEARGYFRLRLYLPNGLSQVPIVLRNDRGIRHSVLLTMRVDPKDVSLNVKVIRPTKTKIVTVVEKIPVRYSVGIDLAPMSFSENVSPSGQSDLSLQQTSFQSLRLDGAMKSTKWWWLLDYEFSTFKTPSSVDGKTVKSGGSNLQSAMIGGKYRLTNSENELWLGLDVDTRFFPLLTVNIANEVFLVDAKVFRAGLSLTYFGENEDFDWATSIFYREPFVIKVNSGEIAYTSKYSTGLNAEMNFKWGENWTVGAAAETEFSSFSYEYTNTPSLISNKGSGNMMIFQLMAKVQYLFGGKEKETNP